jgi:hypothetical protein
MENEQLLLLLILHFDNIFPRPASRALPQLDADENSEATASFRRPSRA